MSNRYWNTSNNIGLSSNISVELYELILIDLAKSWLVMPLGVDEILLENIVRHELTLIGTFNVILVWKACLTQKSFILLKFLFLL